MHYEADVTVGKSSIVGVWVAEVPPTERVDEFPPYQPMCLAQ